MPAFSSFNTRLPDPAFNVNAAGAQVTGSGSPGPGFASVTVRSQKDTQVSRTNSGRGIHREVGSHKWEIDINYHPMPRESFDVVQAFLDAQNARLNPFYVVLPQHSKPKNVTFATTASTSTLRVNGETQAGASYFLMDGASFASGGPSPGDYFNIVDSGDVNHKKAYRITRVETTTDYNSSIGSVTSGNVRVHFSPPLVKKTSDNAVVKFINPEFRVIARSDVLEYQLSTDNLYQFQLQLEEILP